MKTITRKDLIKYLKEIVGSKPMTFKASTEPDMWQKIQADGVMVFNPYWKRARCVTVTNVMVGVNYNNSVENQLEREGKSLDEFQRGTSWHQPILNDGRMTPLCTNKNAPGKRLYLRAKREKTLKCHFVNPLTGGTIPKQRISPFIKPHRNYENQGTDKKVELYTVDMANVLEVTINKQKFKVIE